MVCNTTARTFITTIHSHCFNILISYLTACLNVNGFPIGVITNDDAHLALFKVDDILEALRGNVTRAVQGLAKEEKMECMNIESTDQLIREAIIRFKANRTGQKDFARHVTGGRVVYSK